MAHLVPSLEEAIEYLHVPKAATIVHVTPPSADRKALYALLPTMVIVSAEAPT